MLRSTIGLLALLGINATSSFAATFSMLCNFNGGEFKPAQVTDSAYVQIIWSDGPKMTYNRVSPISQSNPETYVDTLGGTWNVNNWMRAARNAHLAMNNPNNGNTIYCKHLQ